MLPAALLLLAAPAVLSSYWVGLLTQMVIFAILAMSLDILLGYTGLPSLGHAGIFGVAAYARRRAVDDLPRRFLDVRGWRHSRRHCSSALPWACSCRTSATCTS